VARKNQQSSKKNHCDICGTVLTEEAVVQEFPDGSLARLCQECAEAAAPMEEVAEDQYDVAEDATKEWDNPADDGPPAVVPPPEDPPSTRKRAKTSAKKTEAVPEIFDAETFDPELFDLERAAPALSDTHLDSQERVTSEAEAELAAWASAESTDDALAEDPESGYESEADFDSEVTREEAHDAESELATAIAEADLAAASGAEATSVDSPPESEHAEADYLEATAELPAEIEPDFTETSPAASEAEFTAKTEVAAQAVGAEAEVTPEAAEATEVETGLKTGVAADDKPEDETEGLADEETTDGEATDKTKELLMPVSDLISLQNEMQNALARLSSTLEHFVTEIIASDDKTALMTERLHQLEEELETTRERLRVTETLLPDSDVAALEDAGDAEEPTPATGSAPESEPVKSAATVPPPLPAPPVMPAPTAGKKQDTAAPPPLPEPSEPPGHAAPPPLPKPEAKGEDEAAAAPPLPGAKTIGSAAARVAGAAAGAAAAAASAVGAASAAGAAAGTAPAAGAAAGAAVGAGADAGAPPIPAPPTQRPAPGPSGAAAAVQRFLRSRKAHQEPPPEPEPDLAEPESTTVEPEGPGLAFQINEVQAAQRYFNGSVFVKKIRDINRSIGKPKANLSRVAEGQPQAVVTVFWDIVWYQYLVDLRKELPAGSQRIVLDREGMDLEELEPRFREKNATVNDDGRLDASELEVGLLSDPSALITEMDPVSEETVVQEDATEEIWDQQSAPEFRWD